MTTGNILSLSIVHCYEVLSFSAMPILEVNTNIPAAEIGTDEALNVIRNEIASIFHVPAEVSSLQCFEQLVFSKVGQLDCTF